MAAATLSAYSNIAEAYTGLTDPSFRRIADANRNASVYGHREPAGRCVVRGRRRRGHELRRDHHDRGSVHAAGGRRRAHGDGNQPPSQSANATVYVTTYAGKFTHHNDNLRTGSNVNETVLSAATVNSAVFGKLFTWQLDGTMHASPLYVANVNIPGGRSPQCRLCRDGARQRLCIRRRRTERDAAVESKLHQSGGGRDHGSRQRHRRMLRYRERNRDYGYAGDRSGDRDPLRSGQDQGSFRRDELCPATART